MNKDNNSESRPEIDPKEYPDEKEPEDCEFEERARRFCVTEEDMDCGLIIFEEEEENEVES